MNSLRNYLEKLWFKAIGKYGKKSLFSGWRKVSGSEKIEYSPNGKYSLTTANYWTGPGTWNYSKGTVRDIATNKVIAEVCRNYGHFWFSWVEAHPDNHDYLLCGEDYQGQTIIRLDTGERKDFLPESAKKGWGFCWTDAKPSPDKTKLAVHGCYWACPYEIVIVNFTKPLESLEVFGFADCNDNIDDLVSWNDDGTVTVKVYEEYRKSDGKSFFELTDEERSKAYDENDDDYRDALRTLKIKENPKESESTG